MVLRDMAIWRYGDMAMLIAFAFAFFIYAVSWTLPLIKVAAAAPRVVTAPRPIRDKPPVTRNVVPERWPLAAGRWAGAAPGPSYSSRIDWRRRTPLRAQLRIILEIDFMQHLIYRHEMTGRPRRSEDREFAQRVSKHMTDQGLSLRGFASSAGLTPATLSRSLAAAAFSDRVYVSLMRELGDGEALSDASSALHKVLRLVRRGDRIRVAAEAELLRALDRIAAKE